ncbi:MAG: cobalamin B12-binding domain-containing protein, partial [Syntrophobacteraceae bacterium]|nr:cobalamin B12-binding domain-containing protein [Syntrophobacteraceae bacterium]
MSDIVMVVPRYVPLKRQSYYEFPLGMAYVSSCLTRAGHSVSVVNLNQGGEECYEGLAKTVAAQRPRLVLTGGLSAHYQQIQRLVTVVREASPETLIVVGGGVVTASPSL